MLILLLWQQPQALGAVLKNTPPWVWGLLAALLALGLSQVRTRQAGALRMVLMPVVMTGLALSGTVSAFGRSPLFGYVMLAWLGGAAASGALIARQSPPAGTAYDGTRRSFTIPGSWLPFALILGIFLTKYVVGVDLVMQPQLAQHGLYPLAVGTLYGVFSGVFAGRSARLWRLARRPAAAASSSPLLNT